MKLDFNQTKGRRSSKGDKIPAMSLTRGAERHKATIQRRVYKQTVCNKDSTGMIHDAVIYQMKSVEGITYYMARETENRWLESQYCYAEMEKGKKFRVSKSGSDSLWYRENKAVVNSDAPEF